MRDSAVREKAVIQPLRIPTEIQQLPTDNILPSVNSTFAATQRYFLQVSLLASTLSMFWSDRNDVFVGSNMFIYSNMEQIRRQLPHSADFFAASGVEPHNRKSWVLWEEGKAPDMVLDVVLEGSPQTDRDERKSFYQNQLRVPEYFCFYPFNSLLEGFVLHNGIYVPLEPDTQGRLVSHQLSLALTKWDGFYLDVEAQWLRFATLDGTLLLTDREMADTAQLKIEEVAHNVEKERNRAERERHRADKAEALLTQEKQRIHRERQTREQAQSRISRMAVRLRELGVDPDEI